MRITRKRKDMLSRKRTHGTQSGKAGNGRGMIGRGIRLQTLLRIPLPNIPLSNLHDLVFALLGFSRGHHAALFNSFAYFAYFAVPSIYGPVFQLTGRALPSL